MKKQNLSSLLIVSVFLSSSSIANAACALSDIAGGNKIWKVAITIPTSMMNAVPVICKITLNNSNGTISTQNNACLTYDDSMTSDPSFINGKPITIKSGSIKYMQDCTYDITLKTTQPPFLGNKMPDLNIVLRGFADTITKYSIEGAARGNATGFNTVTMGSFVAKRIQ